MSCFVFFQRIDEANRAQIIDDSFNLGRYAPSSLLFTSLGYYYYTITQCMFFVKKIGAGTQQIGAGTKLR